MLWMGLGFCWSKLGAATVENEVPQKTENGSPTLGHNIQRKHRKKKNLHPCVHSSTTDSSRVDTWSLTGEDVHIYGELLLNH